MAQVENGELVVSPQEYQAMSQALHDDRMSVWAQLEACRLICGMTPKEAEDLLFGETPIKVDWERA